MSLQARLARVVAAAAVVATLGLLAGWFVDQRSSSSAESTPEAVAALAPSPPASTPTPLPPTATPLPTPTVTPTPVPTPLPFGEAMSFGALVDGATLLQSPLPDCDLVRNDEVVAGTVTLQCLATAEQANVVAAAAGRIVHVATAPAVAVIGSGAPAGDAPSWSWQEQTALGPHVVVDHGPFGDTSNTQTVYAGLATIGEDIRIGVEVTAGQQLGTVAGPTPAVGFSVWTDGVRQDGAEVVVASPPADAQLTVALALRDTIASPTDPRCPLVLGWGQLPGAPRDYRNGTHQGIDFGCGDSGRSAFAIADGTVVYVVDDYRDPSVPEREALLQQAALAQITPHWTLVMLYGNVVIIDHGEIEGAGRVVTIAAHLESVDEAINIGDQVEKGQRLGELGNRGTNAAALGLRGAQDPSLHLHWELFIDNWYLGQGLDAATVSEIIATALCGAAETAGCPAQ